MKAPVFDLPALSFEEQKALNNAPPRPPVELQITGDRVLVKTLPEEEQRTAAGLIMPRNCSFDTVRGKVLAVGPGRRGSNGERMVMGFEPGQTVLYVKGSGIFVRYNEDQCLLIPEGEIVAIEHPAPSAGDVQ